MKETCPEDLNKMTPVAGGRFCTSCVKPVMDFTHWKQEDILAFYSKHPLACGRFRLEQVEHGLVPLPSLKRVISVAAFFTGVFIFSGGVVSAQTKGATKTEQLVPRVRDNSRSDVITKRESIDVPAEDKPAAQVTKKHKRIFISRRFPFIFRRHRHWMGCPRF